MCGQNQGTWNGPPQMMGVPMGMQMPIPTPGVNMNFMNMNQPPPQPQFPMAPQNFPMNPPPGNLALNGLSH